MNLDTYLSWLNDAEVIRYLTTPRLFKQSAETVRAYIKSHDDRDNFLFGIFCRWCSHRMRQLGLIVPTCNIGYMIGDKQFSGRNVVNPTRVASLDFLF